MSTCLRAATAFWYLAHLGILIRNIAPRGELSMVFLALCIFGVAYGIAYFKRKQTNRLLKNPF